MLGNAPVTPTGGWIQSLSEKARREIARRFPSVDVIEINRLAEDYGLRCNDPQPSPEELRKPVQAFLRDVKKLEEAAEALRCAAVSNLWSQAEVLVTDEVGGVATALERVRLTAEKTLSFLPLGRFATPRNILVWSSMGVLQRAGYPVNSKPSGPVCLLIEIVLCDLGEHPSDVRAIVKPVVDHWKHLSRTGGDVSREA